ncbi:F-box protein At3g12350 isoform X2 [Magnolia sinica]|uniref:F-box protein At3g12350 isoform X2 n=1 Tax=Magnolia sinica TaxID=86752 RepID=UPI00265B2097|nr:F-box protein At3g12350 isoform X2 [Magnolia sinica]
MADFGDPKEHAPSSISFVDFPEDVQLSILSFLSLPEISSFSLTCKRFLHLARPTSQIWYSLCHRRWSTKTHIHAWGNGQISFHLLYKTLSRYEDLIGFWRRVFANSPSPAAAGPPLVFFEWGPSYITGYRISPSRSNGYIITKTPFIWMGISSQGEHVNFIGSPSAAGEFARAAQLGFSDDPDLVPVNVCFVGKNHVVFEENQGYCRRDDSGITEDGVGREGSPSSSSLGGSPPDRVMSEIYQYFANRTSPSGDRASRRQRKKDRARQGKRRWESEHYLKIVNCSPTPSRPLQGLWKVIRSAIYVSLMDDAVLFLLEKYQ